MKNRGKFGFKKNTCGIVREITDMIWTGQSLVIYYLRGTEGTPDLMTPSFDGSPWCWFEYDGIKYQTEEDYRKLQIKVEREKIAKMLDEL